MILQGWGMEYLQAARQTCVQYYTRK